MSQFSASTSTSSPSGPQSSGDQQSGRDNQQSGRDESSRPSSAVERSGQGSGAALKTDRGTTSIASAVVAKIAGLATREIPGVQAMGKSASRTFGAIRAKVPGSSAATSQGVSVEVGERQAAVDIDIVIYYGQSIVETADAIRANVIDQIENMTGLEVVEVNVGVDDLFLDADGDSDSRVE